MHWSLIKCPSIFSTPLYRQSVLSISPISSLSWLYITFRLYFGVKTMWYLHIHFVCAKEFAFLAIINHLSFSYNDSLNNFIISERWFLCITILSLHPHSRWFFISHIACAQLTKVTNSLFRELHNHNHW